ncbi:MAG: hypothetical protein M3Y72_04145 [Acidobacteriota bacterium]|nr:hypothetical protein [Acidobacteriota bacterium]
MSTLDQNQKAGSAEEQLFITKALVAAEKAEKISRIKRIVASVLALTVAVWLAIKAPGPQFDTNALLIIVLFAIAACTQKVLSLNNKNARAILQAIAQLQRQSRSSQ